MSNGNGNNSGQQGSHSNGLQGRGCGNGGGHGHGHGNGGRGFGGHRNNQRHGWTNNNYVKPKRWNNMSWEEQQAIPEARNRARSANNMNMNGGQDNDSAVAGPPTTVNVANGVDVNNNSNHQTNTTNQANQGSTNPGTMIQKMMSNASTCGANASNGTCQVKIMVNGTTYLSVNATVQYCISQQASNNKGPGTLVDSGANGRLLGEDIHILEHFLNGFVNITGVAGNELTNLKLAQGAALVERMADGLLCLSAQTMALAKWYIPRDKWSILV